MRNYKRKNKAYKICIWHKSRDMIFRVISNIEISDWIKDNLDTNDYYDSENGGLCYLSDGFILFKKEHVDLFKLIFCENYQIDSIEIDFDKFEQIKIREYNERYKKS